MPLCKTCGKLHTNKRIDHPRLYSEYCSTKCSLTRLRKEMIQNEPNALPRIRAVPLKKYIKTYLEVQGKKWMKKFMKRWLEAHGVRCDIKKHTRRNIECDQLPL